MLAPSPPTETVAFSFSKASLNCARVCFLLPRISMLPAKSQATSRLWRLFSSPQCSARFATTRPPRVFLGSSAAWMPFESWRRMTRDSMFAGDGSKASPCASDLASSSRYVPRASSSPVAVGISARSGCSVGTKMPRTRFAGFRYRSPARCTSSSVTLRRRSRYRKNRRQLPVAANSDSARTKAPVSSCDFSKSLSSAVRARSTSSAVIFSWRRFSTAWSSASRALSRDAD